MRYRDLKQERDDAILRAVEAERMSMKSEFDRVTAEHMKEQQRLIAEAAEDVKDAYLLGFEEGHATCEAFIVDQLRQHREVLPPTEVAELQAELVVQSLEKETGT